MNRDVDKSAKTALRSHKPPKAQQLVSVQKKKKDPAAKDAQSGSKSCQGDSEREPKSAAPQGKRPVKVCPGAPLERPGAQRKLSDASNASEDLSKDSGCPSGKLSSSDSSSEISDCPSEGNNKHDFPSGDSALSWIDGGAYLFPDGEARGDGRPRVKAAAGLSLFNSTGSFMDLMMGETTEDVFREVEDLRSENEYLKVSLTFNTVCFNCFLGFNSIRTIVVYLKCPHFCILFFFKGRFLVRPNKRPSDPAYQSRFSVNALVRVH